MGSIGNETANDVDRGKKTVRNCASSRTESKETKRMGSEMKRSETNRNHPRIEETTSVRRERMEDTTVLRARSEPLFSRKRGE